MFDVHLCRDRVQRHLAYLVADCFSENRKAWAIEIVDFRRTNHLAQRANPRKDRLDVVLREFGSQAINLFLIG